MRVFLLCGLVALGAPATPALGQAAQDGEIVVQGNRDQQRRVEKFIGALTEARPGEQLAQFHRDACPVGVGLSEAQNQAVTKRMRRVAAEARVPLGPPDCAPNVFFIAAPDKRGLVEGLAKAHPAMFGGMSASSIRELARAPGPAAAWHVVRLLNADGTKLEKNDQGVHFSIGSFAASRLSAATKPHYLASVLVVEHRALAGLSTTQVADYAALRVFADADPARLDGQQADTILTLLEDSAADRPLPQTLTPWDLSFLKSLYATSNSYYAVQQRAAMRQVFGKELERGEEE